MNEYFDLLKKVYYFGENIKVRNFYVKELINQRIVVSNKNNFYSLKNVRDFNVISRYLIGELSWYFSGDINVKGILKYSKFWDKIKNFDDTVNSNYGFLVFYKKNKYNITQFNWALSQLLKDKNTRKSAILYADSEYCFQENLDFVCTQLQQFFIRDNVLDSIVYIRSSDMIFGLTFDIPWWSIVQQYMLLLLNSKFNYNLCLGRLFINFGSVHLYERHFNMIEKMVNSNNIKQHFVKLNEIIPLGKSQYWYEKNINKYIEILNV